MVRKIHTQRGFGRRRLLLAVLAIALLVPALLIPVRVAWAACCKGCPSNVCPTVRSIISNYHDVYRYLLTGDISQKFALHRTWWTDTFFRQSVLPGLMLMTEQLSAVGIHQAYMAGTMLDAQNQLRAQRQMQELQLAAYKDYQPSETLCAVGSNVRSLAQAEIRTRYSKVAVADWALARQLATTGTANAQGQDADWLSRWAQYQENYCDPNDNNGVPGNEESGLHPFCKRTGSTNIARTNIDIDYTRLIDKARTLNANFSGVGAIGDDGEDVFALAANLYGHKTLGQNTPPADLALDQKAQWYLALRSIAAKRSVAQNSLAAIAAIKSTNDGDPENPQTIKTLGAAFKALGVPDQEVYSLIDDNPSQYVQLEVLAQKLYQDPLFYAGLVDKPANIQRQAAALTAIDLMLDRAMFESELRQEMNLSVWLSSALNDRFEAVRRTLPQTARAGGAK
ncbi:MAG: hypothetical protein L6Q57_01870 [Alphaproteobacteria bacterium]|nr:hypothetical protein [Alphaproteobacteria bacterium]